MLNVHKLVPCAATALALSLAPSVAYADTLPPATQKMLAAIKLDPSILDGIDAELKVPDAWVEGAKKEGAVILYDTMGPNDFKKVYSVFSARYPFVKMSHSEVHTSTRRYIVPLTAFKEGRHVVDIIMNLSGNTFLFRRVGAFMNLSDLPNFKRLPDYAHAKDNITVVTRQRYWCMSYNKKLVKESDLPRTWDDLVNGTRFADKKLMIGNRPNNWVLALWQTHGDAWGEEFVRKVFENLKPQLRKEGLGALVKLTGLGEGHAAVPQAMSRVGQYAQTGAPIGFHCPLPVTTALTEAGIMSNSPHLNGARIFLNWFISREGQIAQFWADGSNPVRTELQRKEFLAFPEAVADKKVAEEGEDATKAKLAKAWNERWLKASGAAAKKH
jgi:ABC-type Fe3+ transport system substrate-binding protein